MKAIEYAFQVIPKPSALNKCARGHLRDRLVAEGWKKATKTNFKAQGCVDGEELYRLPAAESRLAKRRANR